MIDWLIDGYYNSRQLHCRLITNYDDVSLLAITIYDRLVITILDNCYCNLQQVLQLYGTIRNDDF